MILALINDWSPLSALWPLLPYTPSTTCSWMHQIRVHTAACTVTMLVLTLIQYEHLSLKWHYNQLQYLRLFPIWLPSGTLYGYALSLLKWPLCVHSSLTHLAHYSVVWGLPAEKVCWQIKVAGAQPAATCNVSHCCSTCFPSVCTHSTVSILIRRQSELSVRLFLHFILLCLFHFFQQDRVIFLYHCQSFFFILRD